MWKRKLTVVICKKKIYKKKLSHTLVELARPVTCMCTHSHPAQQISAAGIFDLQADGQAQSASN
jgi:hypothetical protein